MTRWRYAPEPTYAPERDLSWRTEGDEIARVSRLLGRDPMPWQKRVWDIGTEYRLVDVPWPDGKIRPGTLKRRQYRYNTVLVTVPRQSGKTAGMAPLRLHRMLRLYAEDTAIARAVREATGAPVERPQRTLYSTAQTGKDAGRRMRDMITLVMSSPLAEVFKPHFSTGAEGLEFMPPLPEGHPDRGPGPRLTRFAPVIGAIHGETPHMVDLDEIWKLDEDIGRDIFDGAIEPAQITLHGMAQTWLFSTMGTEQSVFMNRLVKQGRLGARRGLAYFEWSMPDGHDPYNPDTWWLFHPALGNTITEPALESRMPGVEGTEDADEDDAPVRSHAEWMRAYMNRLTSAADPVISDEQLTALVTDPAGGPPDTHKVALAYEVAPESSCATVVAAWRDNDGTPCIRTVHTAPGAAWLPDFIEALAKTWEPTLIAADDGGPARRITDNLRETTDIDVQTLDFRSFVTATDQLLTLARDRGVRLDGSKTLHDGFLRLETRTTNGLARFDRDRSPGPIIGPIAAAVALWAYDHATEPVGLQVF